MEKISFVCNPRIIVQIENDQLHIDSFNIDPVDLVKNRFWKLIEANVCATDEFPATILSIVITKTHYFYYVKIRYWDGVGVRIVNNLYDVETDERVESEREYADL